VLIKCKAIPFQAWRGPEGSRSFRLPDFKTTTTIIIIIINCNWVLTPCQWLFYMYTKHEIGYY